MFHYFTIFSSLFCYFYDDFFIKNLIITLHQIEKVFDKSGSLLFNYFIYICKFMS